MKVGAIIQVGGGGVGPRGLPEGTTSWDGYISSAVDAANLGFDYLLVRAAMGISDTDTNMGPALAGGVVRANVDGIAQAERDGFGWMSETLDAWAAVCARIPTIFYVGLPEFSANRHRSARAIYQSHYKPFVDVGGIVGIDTLLAAHTHASARVYSPAWRVVSHMRQRLGQEVWAEPLEVAASDVWLRKFGLNVLTIFQNGTLFNDRVVVANGYDGWLRRGDVVRHGGRCAAYISGGLSEDPEIRDAIPLRMMLGRRAARMGYEPLIFPWGGIVEADVAELQAYPETPTAPVGEILAANFTAAEDSIPPFDEEDS